MQIKKISLIVTLFLCHSLLGQEDSSKSMPNIRALLKELKEKPELFNTLTDILVSQYSQKDQLIANQNSDMSKKDQLLSSRTEELTQNKKTISRLRWVSFTSTLLALGLIADKMNTRYPELLPKIGHTLSSYMHSKIS
jgi:hypothetical protein